MSKYKPTPEEILNDYTLKWFPYKEGEALWSDTHQDTKRFVRYVDKDMVMLSEIDSMRPLPDPVSRLSVRRLTTPGTLL